MDWKTVTADSEASTQEWGARLAPLLMPGSVLALHGELGVGKTVLTRGVARGLGIVEPVTSPTFTIVQEYRRPDGSWLFHLDMYRISGEDDALGFGIEEYLFVPDGITVIEWPERISGLLQDESERTGHTPVPERTGDVLAGLLPFHLAHVAEDTRRLRIPAPAYRLLVPAACLKAPGSTSAAEDQEA